MRPVRIASKNFTAAELRMARTSWRDEFLIKWQFAPSKFAGYARNDTSHMDKLNDRDGGVTNNRIT